ncbi:MAG: ATP synthase subunit I [Gammaproteobacteria bacterium]|jgi:F1F0 ATPase subunit 2
MSNWLLLVLMFFAGALLAAVYLGGLWLTVNRIHQRRHPALWLLSGFLVRLLMVFAVFYFIIKEHQWPHLLAALAGFVIVRALTIRRVREKTPKLDTDGETPL